jgi:hypothetical protein
MIDDAQPTIWKFPLELTDEQFIELPADARILTVQMQRTGVLHAETPCLWAIVDPAAPKVRALVRIVGTGHLFPDADRLTYISTIQMHDGGLVFHVFVDEGVAH